KAQAFMLGIEAPYYVASATPVRVVTIGGLVINKDAEVLNEQAQAIPGLYAAGEVANASFYYNIYACCGSAVQHAVTFGRIGGINAAQNAK
ncbi:MAG: FAD-binding protein, partial [Clostridia bacterium]